MNKYKEIPPKVSIIIPMYRCESYMEDLLDMVCGQTLKEIEIICVLDGPDDDIRNKVEARANIDDRIICIQQEHGGAGAARNTGLDIAKGDYLLFIDADDLFKPEMAEKLYKKAIEMDADIVACSVVETNEWTGISLKGVGLVYSDFPEETVTDCTSVDRLYESYIGAAWNKLFRRQFIIDKGLRFMCTRIMNDEFFVTAAMTCAERLAVIKEDLMTIRRYINDDSISSNRAKYTEDTVLVLDQIYEWLKKNGYWEKRRFDYYFKVMNSLHYQASYGPNEGFIDGMARMLSTRPPWKNMSNAELKEVLKIRNRDLERIRNDFVDETLAIGRSDDEGMKKKLKMIDNRIAVIHKIRSRMKNEYGRNLSRRDNPFAMIAWSLRSHGWKGTLRKIKAKLEGDRIYKPEGMICAGYVTTAGHYINFFVPAEVYRENAIIEDLALAVRCNGYYPLAVSGKNKDILTQLGPNRTYVLNRETPAREGELMRVQASVSPGLGILIQVRFAETLLKNRKKDKVDNNQPVSVQVNGKIILK